MTDIDKATDDLVAELFPDVPEVEHPAGLEMQEYVFTNDKTNPAPRVLFRIIHESAFKNKLGVMHALDPEANQIVTLLVGIQHDEEGTVHCYPLAKLLNEHEQKEFEYPDGNGNYYKA